MARPKDLRKLTVEEHRQIAMHLHAADHHLMKAMDLMSEKSWLLPAIPHLRTPFLQNKMVPLCFKGVCSMAQRDNTSKRVASEAHKIESKTALAMAQCAATSELKRIFDEEVKQR